MEFIQFYLCLLHSLILFWKEIIEISKEYIDEYSFEKLNLRGDYKYYI